MELKDIVHDLEYGIKLKELGVKQDNIHHWIHGRQKPFVYNHDYFVTYGGEVLKSICSAFTATELLEMLPKHIDNHEFNLIITVNNQNQFVVLYSKINDAGNEEYFYCSGNVIEKDKKLSNALAKMLIYLLENKLMEIK